MSLVVSLDVLRCDVNAGAETLFDEAENFKPVAQIGIDTLWGEIVGRQEILPSRVGGAVLADAGGEFLADLSEAGADFAGRRLGGLRVFAANLLLDEGAADQLIECALAGENALAGAAGVEDGEADFVVDVAGEDDVAVDHGYYAVEDDGRWRLLGGRGTGVRQKSSAEIKVDLTSLAGGRCMRSHPSRDKAAARMGHPEFLARVLAPGFFIGMGRLVIRRFVPG